MDTTASRAMSPSALSRLAGMAIAAASIWLGVDLDAIAWSGQWLRVILPARF